MTTTEAKTISIVRHTNRIMVEVESVICESERSVSVWARRVTQNGTRYSRRRVYNFDRRDWDAATEV